MLIKAWLALLFLLLVPSLAPARGGSIAQFQNPADDAELERHLTTVREQIGNSFLELARREELALEMAGTLDRAAQAATEPEKRRHRWAQAVELLDKFLVDALEPPRRREIQFQAGVYRWATAQSWLNAAEVAPADPKPRQEAVAALDDAIERFRSVGGGGDNPALGRQSPLPPGRGLDRSRPTRAFGIGRPAIP